MLRASEADHPAVPGEQVCEGGPVADDGQATEEQGAGVQGCRATQLYYEPIEMIHGSPLTATSVAVTNYAYSHYSDTWSKVESSHLLP